MNARWQMGFHYIEYTAQAPNAGWNGFSTTGDFYKSFAATGVMNFTPADTIVDTRLEAEDCLMYRLLCVWYQTGLPGWSAI